MVLLIVGAGDGGGRCRCLVVGVLERVFTLATFRFESHVPPLLPGRITTAVMRT